MSSESSNCLFCKIIAGEIPGKFVYRDDNFVAFRDVNPKAPVHLLVCPIAHSETFQVSAPETMAGATSVIQEIARRLGIEDEYTLQINNGAKSGQIVFHLHIHLMSQSTAGATTLQRLTS